MGKVIGFLVAIIVIVGGIYMFKQEPEQAQPTEPTVAMDAMKEKSNGEAMEKAMEIKADTTYKIADGSELKWHGEKIGGSSHDGEIKISEGTLYENEGALVGGEFVIDMTSMTEGGTDGGAVGHLKNEDFFNVEKYPTSKLSVTKLEDKGDGNYMVTADLTILDSTNEITFQATFTKDGDTAKSTASFEIDRTKWGIKYGSGSFFKDLGDKAIKDEISFDLDVTFNKA